MIVLLKAVIKNKKQILFWFKIHEKGKIFTDGWFPGPELQGCVALTCVAGLDIAYSLVTHHHTHHYDYLSHVNKPYTPNEGCTSICHKKPPYLYLSPIKCGLN